MYIPLNFIPEKYYVNIAYFLVCARGISTSKL